MRRDKKSGKNPKALQPSMQAPTKTAKAQPLKPDDRYVVFSFAHADRECPHVFHFKPTAEDAAHILELMCAVSGMTWGQVKLHRSGTRPKHHSQPLNSVIKEAQQRIVDLHLDEVVDTDLFRFRTGSTRRLWGFVQEGIFHVLWWDPDHAVYPTEPSS